MIGSDGTTPVLQEKRSRKAPAVPWRLGAASRALTGPPPAPDYPPGAFCGLTATPCLSLSLSHFFFYSLLKKAIEKEQHPLSSLGARRSVPRQLEQRNRLQERSQVADEIKEERFSFDYGNRRCYL